MKHDCAGCAAASNNKDDHGDSGCVGHKHGSGEETCAICKRCTTCGESGDAPCKTSGGYVAQQPHSARYKLGYSMKMQMVHLDKVQTKPGVKPASTIEELKLAFWYIQTIGGPEKARRVLEIACAALEKMV